MKVDEKTLVSASKQADAPSLVPWDTGPTDHPNPELARPSQAGNARRFNETNDQPRPPATGLRAIWLLLTMWLADSAPSPREHADW